MDSGRSGLLGVIASFLDVEGSTQEVKLRVKLTKQKYATRNNANKKRCGGHRSAR